MCGRPRPSDVLFHRLRDIIGAPEPSYTISEFCKLERFSEPSYFKMKRRGDGPEELTIPSLPGIVRITAKARREWHERMDAEDKKQPGRAFRRDRAKHAAAKPLQKNDWSEGSGPFHLGSARIYCVRDSYTSGARTSGAEVPSEPLH
jgi:hypothetical protein